MHASTVLPFLQFVWGTPFHRRQASDSCATAAELFTTSETIDGRIAQECLLSFPFDPMRATSFIADIGKYVQFQSTLEALKNPPSTYLSSAVDLQRGLDKIANTEYTSQYLFDQDVNRLVRSANDGHFWITLCSLDLFRFYRDLPDGIVSVAKNSRGQPSIYVTRDYQSYAAGSPNVSPIKMIDGQDVIQYLENIASFAGAQDPDARWNTLFYSNAAFANLGNEKIAQGLFVYDNGLWPGAFNTRLEFQNGSALDIPTLAQLATDLDISSSENAYMNACVPPTSTGASRQDDFRALEPRKNTIAIRQTPKAGLVGYHSTLPA
jgi:hypothetical protein